MISLSNSSSSLLPSFVLNLDRGVQNVVLALTIAAVIVWGPIATSRLIHYIDFFRQSGRVVEAFKHAAFAQDRRVGMEPEGKRASE